MIVVFVVLFAMQIMLCYPHPKESVKVSFDEEWNIGSYDFSVSSSYKPGLTFEYNGINYSTIHLVGTLPVESQYIAKKNIIKYSEKGTTFQKFFMRKSASGSEYVIAMYVLVIGNEVYFFYEDLYRAGDYYKFTAEEGKEGTIVAHWQPDLKSFIFWTILISVIISGIAGFFMYADELNK